MPHPPVSLTVLLLLTGSLALTGTACTPASISLLNTTAEPVTPSPVAQATKPTTSAPKTTSASTTRSTQDPYPQALDRAARALSISQSAQSKDDWRLVASRWQQAIDLMKSVPRSNQNYPQAQRKLSEYQRHLTVAQRQANQSTAPHNPDGIVTLPPGWLQPSPAPRPVRPAATKPKANSPRPVAAAPQVNPAPARSADRSQRTFFAPIIRRAGNTPVVRVTFNGSKQFDMILDTGASGTLITRTMAARLGVIPVAETSVDTASQRNVSFPLGYVRSINLGGAVAQNVLVAVAGPDLTLGLLGHDFFGNYDITIRENEVEFRERG